MATRARRATGIVVEAMEGRRMFDASALTEVVSSASVSQVSTVAKLGGKATVTVSNDSGSTQRGPFYIDLYLSNYAVTAGNFINDYGVPFVGGKVIGTLANGASKTLTIGLKGKGSQLPVGTDNLYCVAGDPDQQLSASPAGPTIVVAQPNVKLTETVTFSKLSATVAAGAKSAATAKVLITNAGNDTSAGAVDVSVAASTNSDPQFESYYGTTIGSKTAGGLHIKAGKSVTVTVPLKLVSSLSAGSYFLFANVTDPNGNATSTTVGTPLTVT